MAMTFIDTDPTITPITFGIPFTLFTATSQAVRIDGGVSLPVGTRLLGAVVHKETAFDTNSIAIGTVQSLVGNIATSAEVAATSTGVVLPATWQNTGAAADLLLSGPRAIYAALGAGSLPTAGLIRVTFLTWRLSERTTY